jgi:sortase A
MRAEFAQRLGQRGGPGTPSGDASSGDVVVTIPKPGQALGVLQIPRIDLDAVVVNGVREEDLKRGPGHYLATAYPWEERGTVAIAGHRTTYGQPFWSIDELRRGDRIRLITEYGTYEYRVTRTVEVRPTENSVLEQTEEPTLVLTTCSPRFSASNRLVVFAERVSVQG